MPMSPRLLRPRASGSAIVASDADARAYVLAVNTADGQPLEPAVQLAINDFVVGCKADGIWSAIKASCILMGARTLSGALTPLVGSAPTNNNFVAGDYNRKTGLVGDGATKYLNSNRSNSADSQNNNHNAVYVSTAASTTASYLGASGSISGANAIYRNDSIGGVDLRNRSSSNAAGSASTALFLGATRSVAANFTARLGGSSTTFVSASAPPSSDNVFIFARSSSPVGLFANARIAFYSIGESLDLALLDSRVTTLYNAIGAAIP